MKRIAIIIAVLALCAALYPNPAMAHDDTTTTKRQTFGGVLYEVGVWGSGVDHAWGNYMMGLQMGQSNIWIGAEAITNTSGSEQGGIGPAVFWIDEVRPWFSVVADLGYMSEMVYNPNLQKYGWGVQGGLGAIFHLTDDSHIAIGPRFYPSESGGRDLETITIGGGLFLKNPDELIFDFLGGIIAIFAKGG